MFERFFFVCLVVVVADLGLTSSLVASCTPASCWREALIASKSVSLPTRSDVCTWQTALLAAALALLALLAKEVFTAESGEREN